MDQRQIKLPVSLDAVAADPAIVSTLSSESRSQIVLCCSAIIAACAATATVEPNDGLVDVDTARTMLGVSRSWLYHRSALPFVVKVGGRRMYSRDGIQKFIARNQGKD